MTDREIALLDRFVPDRAPSERTLSASVVKVARLGGYLVRSRDPPPCNLVMSRGFAKLADITLGSTPTPASPGFGESAVSPSAYGATEPLARTATDK